MTITNTITVSEVLTYKTKTEVFIDGDKATFSRLIDGKLRSCEINDATMRGLTNICKLDDNMFKMICVD